MFFVIGILIVNAIVVCSDIEDGWKKIKPLMSDKSSVNRILGSAKVDANGYFDYEMDDVSVEVNYSTSPCQDNQYDRGKFDIPESRVLDYNVYFKKPIKLSELKFDRKKYYKDTSGDKLNGAAYRSDEHGISIGVEVRNDEEFVYIIYFRPTKADIAKYACK